MNLPKNIKPKIGIWKLFPNFISKNTANTICPNIYLPEKIYNNLLSNNPNLKYICILRHEQKHLNRQIKNGFKKWILKYIFIKKYRLEEEIIAITTEMEFCKKNTITFDINKRSKILSSWIYFWPSPFKKIKFILEDIWINL